MSSADQTTSAPPAQKRSASLRGWFAALIGIAMLPLGLLAFWQAGSNYRTALGNLERNLTDTASLAATDIAHIFNLARQVLTTTAAGPGEMPIQSGKACEDALQRLSTALAGFTAAMILDDSGRLVCSSYTEEEEARDAYYADRQWFQETKATGTFVISELLRSRIDNVSGIVVGLLVRDANGDGTGVISTMIAAEQLAMSYDRAVLPTDAVFAVLDRRGEVVFARTAEGSDLSALPEELSLSRLASGPMTFMAMDRTGGQQLYAVERALDGSLFVLIGVPASTVLNPAAIQFAGEVFIPVLMWLVIISVVSFGMQRLVVRWIGALETVTREYAAGNSGARPRNLEAAPAEIRALGESFTRMADLIDARERELKDSLAQKDALVREVHHRVKNSMQLVTSLLNLHSRQIKDPQVEIAFAEARTRINALATIHRRIYEADTLRDIDLHWYLEGLCEEVRRSDVGRHCRIEFQMADSGEQAQTTLQGVRTDTAVPLGLLVMEALAQACKVTGVRERRIPVPVIAVNVRIDGGLCAVEIEGGGQADQPVAAQDAEVTNLGRSLLSAYARQLHGEFLFATEPTWKVAVKFPVYRQA